jgi:hypothetical protein
MKKIMPKALLGVVSFVLGIITTIKVFLAIVDKLDCIKDLKWLIGEMISNALYGAPPHHYTKYTRRTGPYRPYNPPKWDGSKYAYYYRDTTVKEDFDDEEKVDKETEGTNY